MLHRIRKIISVVPYAVTCEWTDGAIRIINMEQKIKEWSDEPQSVFKHLLDKNVFAQVKLDTESKTLFWGNLVKMRDTSGNLIDAPLDIDPEVLYQMSVPFDEKENIAA